MQYAMPEKSKKPTYAGPIFWKPISYLMMI